MVFKYGFIARKILLKCILNGVVIVVVVMVVDVDDVDDVVVVELNANGCNRCLLSS